MKSISELLAKWKNRKWSKTDWLICLLGGILLLVIALPTSDSKEESSQEEPEKEQLQITEEEDYKMQLEQELEELLRSVSGAGKVKVMITLKDQGEEILDKNIISDETSHEQETVQFEKEDETVPYVTKTKTPSVEGVVVVAEGGGNSMVRTNLTEMVLALFPVETHKVKIVPMDKE